MFMNFGGAVVARRCSAGAQCSRIGQTPLSEPHMTDSAASARPRDAGRLAAFIDKLWDAEVVPTLVDYIRIPNKSPSFDADWAAHGHMDKVVAMFEAWAR